MGDCPIISLDQEQIHKEVIIMDMTKLSYDEYRKHMDQLSFRKRRLNTLVAQKQDAHRIYREAYQKYRQLEKEQDKITKEILDLLPN